MRLLFISLNYAPDPTGTGLYTGQLCEALAAMGHEVHVICAYPYYPEWKFYGSQRNRGWTREVINGVNVHRCMTWLPKTVSGAKRIVHYATFSLSSVVPLLGQLTTNRPDMMVVVTPTLMPSLLTNLLGRLRQVPSWVHVQDFEVEAGFATGQLSADGVWGRLALQLEKLMFAGFDRASSISPEMCAKLKGKGVAASQIYELRNWADVKDIRPQATSSYRLEWNIATPHVALYSGSIARKQGIEMLLDVARLLERRGDTTLVICGNGPYRAELEEAAQGIGNLRFYDLQPAEMLSNLLSLATVHLLPQKEGAADLVLPSKLCNMLASGRTVVAAASGGTGLARELEGVGIAVPPEDPAAMAGAIEWLLEHPDERARLGRCARQRAERRWGKDAIIEGFDREIKREHCWRRKQRENQNHSNEKAAARHISEL